MPQEKAIRNRPNSSFGLFLGLSVGLAVSVLGFFVGSASQMFGFADILFYRMFWSALILLPFVHRKLPRIVAKDSGYLWLRSIFGGCSALSFFYTLTHSSIALANLLANFSPVWVIVIGRLFFGERLSRSQLVGAAIATIAVLSLSFGGVKDLSVFVALIGIMGSLFAALALVSLRQASQGQDLFLIVFLMSCVTALIALPFCDRPFAVLAHYDSVMLWGVVFSSIVYQSTLTYQYRMIDASVATVLNETALFWSMLVDYVFFARSPGTHQVVVVVLVFCGLLIVQKIPQYILTLCYSGTAYVSSRRRS